MGCYTRGAVIPVQENIRLAPLTTLGIGGPARRFARASTEDALVEALEVAADAGWPRLVLGGGSNLLVSDAGFDGLVLAAAIGGVKFTEAGDGTTRVTAGAGVNWDSLVSACVGRGLAGIECLSGIPGWVGATPIQNVGAYGQEVSDVIARVRAYDRQTADVVELSAADCGFSYRTSVFNTTARGRYVVLSVTYVLRDDAPPAIGYPDVARAFDGRAAPPSLRDVRDAVRRIRASKAMLLTDGDADVRSAGSFFKNPIVDESAARGVDAAAGAACPRYPADGGVKLPAAWLIERAGFGKGTRRGRVGLSTKHTLALINRGGASASDVLSFAGEIQEGVEAGFGVRLRPEPAFVGFPDDVVRRFGAVSA